MSHSLDNVGLELEKGDRASRAQADRKTEDGLRNPLPAFALNARPGDRQKTIAITGVARGGTSFTASVVANLNIPFSISAKRFPSGESARVGRRYSVNGLQVNWWKDREQFGQVCRHIDAEHDVWGIKLAGLAKDLDDANRLMRNPHFIFSFKEPLSVAMRGRTLKGKTFEDKGVLASMSAIIAMFDRITEFCRRSGVPCLLLSFDKAMSDRPAAVKAVAEFIGVSDYDAEHVAACTVSDKSKYQETSIRRVRRIEHRSTAESANADSEED